MKKSNAIKISIPFFLIFVLLALLGKELFYFHQQVLPSALLGEPLPDFQLPNLLQPEKWFTQKNLIPQVVLLNVWASWCDACALEQPILLAIKQQYHIPIYGIDYKDNPADAKNWLLQNGNPYVAIGNDYQGDTAINLGVYGTPETFIINRQGKIIYRQVGAINQKTWDTILYPLIRRSESALGAVN